MKIIIEDKDKTLEINFETKNKSEKSKFNPTTENKIHVEFESDDEDKYWYFL